MNTQQNITANSYNGIYDVFISCKSEDYPYGRMVYDYLTQKGVKVFLADTELRKQGIANYGNVIDSALDSSKHLIVVTTSSNYTKLKFSPYVYYEWHTFSEEVRSGRKTGNIMTVVRDKSIVKSLPIAIRNVQSFSFEEYQQVYDYVVGETPQAPAGPMAKIRQFMLNLRLGKNLGCAVTIVLFAFIGVVLTPIFIYNNHKEAEKTRSIMEGVGQEPVLFDLEEYDQRIERRRGGCLDRSSKNNSTICCCPSDTICEVDTEDYNTDWYNPDNDSYGCEADGERNFE